MNALYCRKLDSIVIVYGNFICIAHFMCKLNVFNMKDKNIKTHVGLLCLQAVKITKQSLQRYKTQHTYKVTHTVIKCRAARMIKFEVCL